MSKHETDLTRTELLMHYPLFMPPVDLAEKGHLNWNKKEFKRYFEWFICIWEQRVSFFVDFFNLKYSTDPEIMFDIEYSEMLFNLFNNNTVLTEIKKNRFRQMQRPI